MFPIHRRGKSGSEQLSDVFLPPNACLQRSPDDPVLPTATFYPSLSSSSLYADHIDSPPNGVEQKGHQGASGRKIRSLRILLVIVGLGLLIAGVRYGYQTVQDYTRNWLVRFRPSVTVSLPLPAPDLACIQTTRQWLTDHPEEVCTSAAVHGCFIQYIVYRIPTWKGGLDELINPTYVATTTKLQRTIERSTACPTLECKRPTSISVHSTSRHARPLSTALEKELAVCVQYHIGLFSGSCMGACGAVPAPYP